MSRPAEAQPMDTTQKEIVEMKTDIKSLQKEVQELKQITTRHDGRIQAIENMLNNINENTTWLKRTITNAIIGAVCTGFIGGGIAIIFTVFKGGS
ncbi:protein xhlA [Priestia megaterium]|uniref:hemolysin XhlA family protein n=2 Tax=Priestia megaterium TaxID=1404 RepID=UPI000BF8EBA0|nr:hemolysin XhlA family protein [Priestia megaterium]MDP1471042.1 hemolysin XhlA family protein [Priestia megaterium]PFL01153.1 protein xhlA [Priestia megaterium]